MEIPLTVVLSDEEARDRINNLKLKALGIAFETEKAKFAAESADKTAEDAKKKAEEARFVAKLAATEAQNSFRMVMAGMRTSYLLFSGVARVMGGGMTMIFRTLYSVGMAAVGTYSAIAAAAAASGPAGWVQAGLMLASLTMASMQLSGVMRGQRDLARNMRGVNMMLHGISGLLSTYGSV